MMAWAIFERECNWVRPNSRFSFNAMASVEPQQRPRDFIEHCVGMGWAKEAPPPTRTEAEALKPKRKRGK